MCLQPCGSDMIRQSGSRQRGCDLGAFGGGAEGGGGEASGEREQVKARKSLFPFHCKNAFPPQSDSPDGPEPPGPANGLPPLRPPHL